MALWPIAYFSTCLDFSRQSFSDEVVTLAWRGVTVADQPSKAGHPGGRSNRDYERQHGSFAMIDRVRLNSFGPSSSLRGGLFLVAATQLTPFEGLHCRQVEDPSPHSAAELIAEVKTVRPGEPFTVAVRIALDSGWHSYWLNPGDAGQPASIDWALPAGFGAGEIQWPYPKTVEESTAVSYGYDDEVVLLTEIVTPRFMTTGQTVNFAADVRWLVCHNICLPARADLELEMRLADEPPASDPRWRKMFAEARSRLPMRVDAMEMSASLNDDTIVLQIVPARVPARSFEGAHFFAGERGVIVHGAAQRLTHENGIVLIALQKSRFLRAPLARLTGVLVMADFVDMGTGRTRALSVDAAVTEAAFEDIDTEHLLIQTPVEGSQ